MWSAWWLWALAATVLAIVEVAAPGYIALGFGIGAGLVALGLFSGALGAVLPLTGGYGFAILLILFGVLSALAWVCLRAVFGPIGGTVETFEDDVND